MNPETEREPLRRVEIHDFRLDRQAPALQRRRQFEPVRDRKNRVQRMPRIDRQRRLDRYGFIRQDRRLERKRRGRDQAVQRAPVIRIRKPVRLAVEFDLTAVNPIRERIHHRNPKELHPGDVAESLMKIFNPVNNKGTDIRTILGNQPDLGAAKSVQLRPKTNHR